MDRLFAPPTCQLPPEMEHFRFWVWVQLILVRMYIRSIKGPGVPFRYTVNRRGDLIVLYVGKTEAELDAALARLRQLEPKKKDPIAWEPSKALTAALDGSGLISAHPGESRGPGQQAMNAQFWVPAFAVMSAKAAGYMLPPPDT
ncbi:hypothetical protein HY29_12750 [Hyphomonas beringensis]|uniref:Uncharacterized protein n=1 Tax=Hyphomonas beringensis TaxID=1280946 RepID=A0A062UFM1_9PROT|nr:hypothetical protein [Hyphomonas beringensis]KCZ55399.1 hypothetical protein HY29_12750 [Hyphomonas beringensis]